MRLWLLTLALALASCTTVPSIDGDGVAPPFVSPDDFYGVNFKPGQPVAGSDLVSSLATPRDIEALHHDLSLIESIAKISELRVEGHTDSSECSGQDCVDLSLRRARYLTEWFVSQGVPASMLHEPKGFGSDRPIRDNSSESGRTVNRRAYISYGW